MLDRGLKLPAQPRVLEEVQQLVRHKEKDLRVIARTIAKDAGMVAQLFKVVRSSAYRQHQPFVSLEKVLHSLGVAQALNLLTAIALTRTVTKSNEKVVFEAFWARSTAIAQLALLVAEDRVSVCNVFPEHAFLAGIFHDCGVPLLMQRFGPYLETLRLNILCGRGVDWGDVVGEDRKFQTDHCVVGYMVARHWHLPDQVAEAIRLHHELPILGDHPVRSLVAVLQMAMHLYHRNLHQVEPEWETVGEAVVQGLGLPDDGVGEFMDEILDRYQMEMDGA